MEKSVLVEMLEKEGVTFEKDGNSGKINEAICATANHYGDQIIDAIGDIPYKDAPVIIIALRSITKILEEIEPEVKLIAYLIESRTGSKAIVTKTAVERK